MMSQSAMEIEVEMKTPPRRDGFGARVVDFIDDHINPIVVKELRQAVRSSFVTVVINVLLLIELAIVTINLLGSTDRSFTMGRNVFTGLHFLLLIVSVIFVPIYVGVRFAAERSAQNVDLMFTTTISPLSIIWGKFLSGAIIAALLFSTAGPFMVLTYMLRGIDVPTILVIVGIDFLAVLATIQFAILVMSGSISLAARGGLLVLCLILFPYVIFGVGAGTMSFLYGYSGSWWRSDEYWLYIIGFLLLNVAYHVGMMLASAAVVSPPTSNRSMGIRIFLVITWIVWGIICGVIAGVRGENEWMLLWAIASISVCCLMLLVVICERDRWGVRVLTTVPANPIKRFIAFLFYSGSAGGLLMSLLVMGATLGVVMWTYSSLDEEVVNMLTVSLYLTAYCISAVIFTRYLSGGVIKHEATAAIALVFLAIGCMGPVIIAYFVDPQGDWDKGIFWRVGNPFGGMMGTSQEGDTFLMLSGVWASIALCVSVPWMAGQYRAFRRLPTTPLTQENLIERTLELHDQAPPLLDDPQVKADL